MNTPSSQPTHRLPAITKGLAFAAISLAFASCAAPSGSTSGEQRGDVRAMARQTVRELYAAKPESRKLIANCAGFAVFNQNDTKILALGSTNGYGLAVNKRNDRETYLRVGGLSAGFGAGLVNSRTVIIFRKDATFRNFITNGWSMEADAQAAAALDRAGAGAGLAVNPAVDPLVYHMTRSGVSLSATVGVEKVWVDSSLNR